MEFRGLSGTTKQKIVTGEWSGAYLNEFVNNGDIDNGFLVQLLEKMKAESVAPKPNVLGIIGKDHLTKWMVSNGISDPSIKYHRCMYDLISPAFSAKVHHRDSLQI